jgi:TIR domain
MGHDVFISHARKDISIADVICEKLESAGVRCWIAARDISASEDWTAAIRKAIESSRVMILVLSENANAAPHIEREIAHAFYTRRIIIPLRLANTLPRRDFLFYLSSVRWFNAFSPHAEQHLEVLAARIKDLVHDSSVCKATPARSATETKSTLNCVNSWIHSLRASRYRTVEILKRVAVAASLVALVWLVCFTPRQTKHEALLTESKVRSKYSRLSASPDSSTPAVGGAVVSKPATTFTRFGLWERPNARPTPSVQQGPQDTPSIAPAEQSASATPSPRSDVDQKAIGEEPKREQDAQRAQQNADLATKQNSALEAQLRKAHEDAQPVHEDAGLVASQPESGQIQALNPPRNSKPAASTQPLDASVQSTRP